MVRGQVLHQAREIKECDFYKKDTSQKSPLNGGQNADGHANADAQYPSGQSFILGVSVGVVHSSCVWSYLQFLGFAEGIATRLVNPGWGYLRYE